VLNGSAAFTGPVLVNGASRVLVDSPHDTITFVVTNNGRLGGTASVGAIIAGDGGSAEVQPGEIDSPGLLQSGDVELGTSASLRLEINGPAPGSGHDQLQVFGTVAITNASLVFTAGFDPATGTGFTVLDNDGADPVQGAFLNLPEGGKVTNGAVVLRITYMGGDGNDVVLTRVTAAPPSVIQPLVLSNGVPVLSGQGVAGAAYVLEATTNLNPPAVWLPVQTNAADGAGWYQFLDLGATNAPMRFYRVQSPE
jgi:hypothetical protein